MNCNYSRHLDFEAFDYVTAYENFDDLNQNENYSSDYTHLHASRMNSFREYYASLNVEREKYEHCSIQSTSNDSCIARLMQMDEFNEASSMTDELAQYIANVERKALNVFSDKVKRKSSMGYSLDQTIEEILDEVDYDNNLDDLIKSCAKTELNRMTSTPKKESHFPKKCESKAKNEKYYSGLNDQFLAAAKTDKANHYAQLNKLKQQLEAKEEERKESGDSSKEDLKEELPFIDHAFSLIKYSNLSQLLKTYQDKTHIFYVKVRRLIRKSSNSLTTYVAHVFLSLLNVDYSGMIENFVSIPFREKWNVLKNLVYYAFKLTLFNISKIFDSDSDATFGLILKSIYNYIKNFHQLSIF